MELIEPTLSNYLCKTRYDLSAFWVGRFLFENHKLTMPMNNKKERVTELI